MQLFQTTYLSSIYKVKSMPDKCGHGYLAHQFTKTDKSNFDVLCLNNELKVVQFKFIMFHIYV